MTKKGRGDKMKGMELLRKKIDHDIKIWIAFGIFFFMGMLTGAKHHKWYDDLIDDDSDENF